MIVSHEHGLVFMKSLKTAGTSVEIALSRIVGADAVITPLRPPDEALRRAEGGRPPQNTKTTAGRFRPHSTARVARDLLGRDVWSSYTKASVQRNPWDAVVSLFYWVGRHGTVLQFDDFLATHHPAQLALRNTRITRIHRRPAMDVVMRYEHLEADLSPLWLTLGLPGHPILPRAKVGARPLGRHYREHYNHRTRELVRREFALVIEEMGYEF